VTDEKKRTDPKRKTKPLARNALWIIFLLVVICTTATALVLFRGPSVNVTGHLAIDRPPNISPDYADITIPPNIAPLNFKILENASLYYVKIRAEQGRPIEVVTEDGSVRIPARHWRRLLAANSGRTLYCDIYLRDENEQWTRLAPVTNTIAKDPIDPYLIYRNISSGHNVLTEMEIRQRDLTSFDEESILSNKDTDYACINCHTFCNNDPTEMIVHVRGFNGLSMLLLHDGDVSSINSRTMFGGKPMGHASWHPSGKVIAFTIYDVRQFYHTARPETRDVINQDSAMGYYLVEQNEIKTTEDLSRKDRLETWPAWSPDGKYLYFSLAPMLWSHEDKAPGDLMTQTKYDLARIPYDLETDTWGQLETVISAEETNMSALMPRISPDGRWLLFCLSDYGDWAGFQPVTSIYACDLHAAADSGRFEYRKLDINSDQADYWKSWSSNSRWLIFSSKRGGGVFTKTYFTHVDTDGNFSKPFVLPQKDPDFYDSWLNVYSLPELVTAPIPVTGEKLARIVRGPQQATADMPITGATPKPKTPVDYGI
jgi:Tol biopolymer transport system component